MKKIIFISILIIIAIVAGLFIFKNNIQDTSSNPNTTPAPTQIKTITLSEVSKHKDASNCWIAIEGNVYDVTSFVPNHPGEEAILLGCGKDATEMFNSRPNDGTSHSNKARQLLQKFLIGVLAK
jgi:cytochrome b involved in lipid metabolism